jgi:MoaA/NifB/PqqE/SkfB family radical SAM enzyme
MVAINSTKAKIVGEHFSRYLKKTAEARRHGGHFPLEDVFVYVTSRCNATCEHCFYWQELNRPEDEIQLDQFATIAATIPPFDNMFMTGGETFLRRDIHQIIEPFVRHDKCHTFQMNTNGFTPKPIERRVREMLEGYPDRRFQVMLSLDGYKETHNKVRNNPKAWDLTTETIGRLQPMMAEFPGRFYVGVLTVLCDQNWREIEPLFREIKQRFGVIHAFELVRGTDFSVWGLDDDVKENYNPPGMGLPPREHWDEIWELLSRLNRESGYLNRFFHVMTKWQLQMMNEKKSIVPCISAGRTTATIYSNGDVAACEFSKPFANLREFEWDFDRLWTSEAADARRAQLTKCSCTHACYLTKNMEYSLKGQLALARHL